MRHWAHLKLVPGACRAKAMGSFEGVYGIPAAWQSEEGSLGCRQGSRSAVFIPHKMVCNVAPGCVALARSSGMRESTQIISSTIRSQHRWVASRTMNRCWAPGFLSSSTSSRICAKDIWQKQNQDAWASDVQIDLLEPLWLVLYLAIRGMQGRCPVRLPEAFRQRPTRKGPHYKI